MNFHSSKLTAAKFAIAIVFLISLIACNQSKVASTSIKLVQTAGEDSCLKYELQDDQGTEIDILGNLKKDLLCPALAKLSPDRKYLLYIGEDHIVENWQLQNYDIQNQKITNLIAFSSTPSGVSCDWSPQGGKIACVVINEKFYNNLTKIFVLSIEKGEMKNKKEYDERVPFVCGSTCYSDNFKFIDENTLEIGQQTMENPDLSKTLDISWK